MVRSQVVTRKRPEVSSEAKHVNSTSASIVYSGYSHVQSNHGNNIWPGSSERVDLSRRGITRCPSPANPASIFLLNLEHNLIRTLDGFSPMLINLVVLSLYDNQLDKMSGLEGLLNLKLLLLGRNRICKIEGVHKLPNLEVLDLHGNQITNTTSSSSPAGPVGPGNGSFVTLQGHPKLRVLNLASNRLGSIDGLINLPHLVELNLRRNRIRAILSDNSALVGMPSLQRIYLSHNQISKIENMCGLSSALNLKEISMGNNPLGKDTQHRAFLLDMCPKLHTIDGDAVTEQIRSEATELVRSAREKARRSAERKDEAIDNAKKRWEFLKSEAMKMSKSQRIFHHVVTSSLNNRPATASRAMRPNKFTPSDHQVDPESLEAIFPLTAKLSRQNTRLKMVNNNNNNNGQHNPHFGPRFRPKTALPAFNSQRVSRIHNNINNTNNNNNNNKIPVNKQSELPMNDGRTRSPAVPSKIDLSLNPSGSAGTSSLLAKAFLNSQILNKSHPKLQNLQQVENHHSIKTVSHMLKFLTKSNRAELKRLTKPRQNNLRKGMDDSQSSSDDSSNESNTDSEDNGATSDATSHTKENHRQEIKPEIAFQLEPDPNPGKQGTITNNKTYKQGKDFVVEITDGVLSLFGQDSLKCLEAKWISEAAQSVTKAKFQFIQHDDLVALYPKFREKFPNLVEFHFQETCLDRLGQLNGLAAFQKMHSLYISKEGNSIVQHPQWKLYAIYRLGCRGLKTINGKPVEPEDVTLAAEAFTHLSQLVFSCQSRDKILQLYCQVSAVLEPCEDQKKPGEEKVASAADKMTLAESTSPDLLQEAIGREALSYQPLPATRETALLKRSRAMNFMQKLVERYSSASRKLTVIDLNEDRLKIQLVAIALSKVIDSNIF